MLAGMAAPIQPACVIPVAPLHGVGEEKHRACCLHAKVWRTTDRVSYDEHKTKVDEVLQQEVRKGHVHWIGILQPKL